MNHARTPQPTAEETAEPEQFSLVEPLTYSTADAARLSGYSIATIQHMVKDGRLRGIQPCKRGKIRIPKTELHRWLAGNLEDTG